MLLRRGQCVTVDRTLFYCGEDSVILQREQCVTEESTV